MGTIHWPRLGFFAALTLVVAMVSATTIIGCSSGGSSDGNLCQQCGETDGPCISPEEVSGDDRPQFCKDRNEDPCLVNLRCVRQIDSAQRRCYPADRTPDRLNVVDVDYECGGERPAPAPTPTPAPTTLPQPSASPTVVFSIKQVDVQAAPPTGAFTVTVTYNKDKGSFGSPENDVKCTFGLTTDPAPTAEDDGNGTLTLEFPENPDATFPTTASCTFHVGGGKTLTDGDIVAIDNSDELTVTVEPLTPPPPEETAVSITVEDPNQDDFSAFTAKVSYPKAKGTFLADGKPECEEEDGVNFADDGNGTLTVTFSVGEEDVTDSVSVICTFHEEPNMDLADGDLTGTVGGGLDVLFDF